jgi:preprotein translocase subunit SecA
MEMAVYSYYSIIGEQHPNLDRWKQVALGMEHPLNNSSMQGDVSQSGSILKENKVGQNDPCLCGSGKKYKKCCGK